VASKSPPLEAAFRVEKPGLLTTVQDLGRPGHRKFGVPPSGAMDRFALAAANRLVGNPDGVAGLECALNGPVLLARQPCLVAVTGADFTPSVNGAEVPLWTGVYLAAGERLSFAGRKWGARCYIAVAGGLAASRWLGSLATYLLVGKGGFDGRALEAEMDPGGVADPVGVRADGREQARIACERRRAVVDRQVDQLRCRHRLVTARVRHPDGEQRREGCVGWAAHFGSLATPLVGLPFPDGAAAQDFALVPPDGRPAAGDRVARRRAPCG